MKKTAGFGTSDVLARMIAHWRDLANRCDRDHRPYFTDFVPAEDAVPAEKIAAEFDVQCIAWGGVDAASRVMLCFVPKNFSVDNSRFPVKCLTLSYRSFKPPTHRDFLGALLACCIKRDTIGDILIGDAFAQVFVCGHVAPVLEQELLQVGCVSVQVSSSQPVSLSPQMNFRPISGTVASLRADAVVAFALRLSREKAASLIRQGKMTCGHRTVEVPSVLMEPGDVFSVRGYGKFRIDAVNGVTRKGRNHITIQKY